MPLFAARFPARSAPAQSWLGLAVALVLLACLPRSRALSWSLCAEGSSTWMTEYPCTAPTFPGANLWFYCRAGINMGGSAVDACYSRGRKCDQDAAADALCVMVGYDRAVYDETSLATISGTGCAIRSVTGEYALGGGSYSSTKPDPKLAKGCSPHPLGVGVRLPVTGLQDNDVVVLDGVTCVRSIGTIRAAISRLGLEGEGEGSYGPIPGPGVPDSVPCSTVPSNPSSTPGSPSSTPSSPGPSPGSADPSQNLPLPELERSQTTTSESAGQSDALSAASATGAGQQTRRRLQL